MKRSKLNRPGAGSAGGWGEAFHEAASAIRLAVEAAQQAATAAQAAATAAQQAAATAQQALMSAQHAGAAGRGAGSIRSAAGAPSPEVGVVIASAVAATLLERPFRVRRIRLASNPSVSWSQIGRVGIHTSHAIEKRN